MGLFEFKKSSGIGNKSKNAIQDLSFGINGFLTAREEFANYYTKNLYLNVFENINERLEGIDKSIKNSMFFATRDKHNYGGLLDIIATAITNQQRLTFKVESVGGQAVYKLVNNYVNQEYNTSNNINYLVLDYTYEKEPLLLNSYYQSIYHIMDSLQRSTELSNKIILKFSGLHGTDKLKENDINNNINNFNESIRQDEGIGYIDAADSVTTIPINHDTSNTSLDMVYSEICQITRLPKSYITGQFSGALSGTGEGEMKQIDLALHGYFDRILKPVLEHVSILLGKDFKNIKMTRSVDDLVSTVNLVERVDSFLTTTTYLTDAQKQQFMDSFLAKTRLLDD